MRHRLSAGRLPEQRRILSWVYLGRLCLAGAIFTAAALVWNQAEANITLAASLILVLAAAFTAGSFWYTHLASRRPGHGYLYSQVVFDVLLVAVVVHYTGGPESDFVPLWVLVIVAAAILLPFVGGVLIGVLVSLLFFADILYSTHTVDACAILQIVIFAAVALALTSPGQAAEPVRFVHQAAEERIVLEAALESGRADHLLGAVQWAGWSPRSGRMAAPRLGERNRTVRFGSCTWK